MRCPHCAAPMPGGPGGAVFCGVCGRRMVAEGPATTPSGERKAVEPPGASMSLFELPVSRSARLARVALVLVLDAVLAGSGIAMGVSWWRARAEASPQPKPAVAAPAPSAPGEPVGEAPPAPAAAPEPPPPEVRAESPRVLGRKSPPAGRRDRPSPPSPAPAPPPGSGGTAPPEPSPAPEPPPAAPTPEPEPTPAPSPPAADDDSEVSTEAVRNIVHEHMGQVKRCYTRAAKVGTNAQPLEGKVEIQFTIRTSGDADEVRVVENNTGSDDLGQCVAQLVGSWKFPSPEEDVEFVWPFVFKAPKP